MAGVLAVGLGQDFPGGHGVARKLKGGTRIVVTDKNKSDAKDKKGGVSVDVD